MFLLRYSHREVVLKTDHFSKPLRGGYITDHLHSCMKKIFLATLCLLAASYIQAQHDSDQQRIFAELKTRDSLLFSLGYNHCDTVQFRRLLSDDFEFYHDQGGITDSKASFIQNIPNLCKMEYKASRVLIEPSLEVSVLYQNNGTIYGAVQQGTHEFYEESPGNPKKLSSTARFIHLWILEDGNWRLKRVLSFDHVLPEKK